MEITSTRDLGDYGERLAARYLTESGLSVVDRNWRCVRGELDIVALDDGCVVVCEVKTRTSTRFGPPAHQISARKAARLRDLAHCWLDEHPRLRGRAVRVDVIGVLLGRSGAAEVTHLIGVDR